MDNKPKLEHAEQNIFSKPNSEQQYIFINRKSKGVDVTNLDKESIDKLIESSKSGEPIVFVGNPKELPPVSAESNVKDIIGKFRESNVGALVVENGEVKMVTPKKKP